MDLQKTVSSHPFLAVALPTIVICSAVLTGMAWLHEQRLTSVTEKYEALLAIEKQKTRQEIGGPNALPSPEKRDGETSHSLTAARPPENKKPNGEKTKSEPPVARYGDVFASGDLFPIGFDQSMIGMPLSKIRSSFPSGQLYASWYAIDRDTGPFNSVAFNFKHTEKHPTVDSILFFFRDELAAKHVKSDAAVKFVGMTAQVLVDGELLRWNAKGMTAELGSKWYSVSRPAQ